MHSHNQRIGINLPLKGVLFGIGAGIGQGVGLVISKIGMNHYMEATPPVTDIDNLVIPFASTIMALTPILIILPSKLIYKEKITAGQVIGAVISVTGASLFFI